VLNPVERAKRAKAKELQADMNNAAELFGAAALGGASSLSFSQHAKLTFRLWIYQ
jgi:hypothetical protein